MNTSFSLLAALAVAAAFPSTRLQSQNASAPTATAPPCVTDSNYQRLAFWVGDWEVYDSTGAKYATQRVQPVIDACAITIEWASGGGNKGMGLAAFDMKSRAWKEVYVSNQVPFRSGVTIRTSDPSYAGPGIRFISVNDQAASDNLVRNRVTILPLAEHGALQQFEESRDGGKTWKVVFKAEHRPRTGVSAKPSVVPGLTVQVNEPHREIEQRFPAGAGEIIDTAIAELRTLRAVAHRSHQPTRTMRFDFVDNDAEGDVAETTALRQSPTAPQSVRQSLDIAARGLSFTDDRITELPS